MSNGTVSLSARIPDPTRMLDLVGQVRTTLEGFGVPGLPLDQIGQVAASMQFNLPDVSNWPSVIPGDVTRLLRNFPDPQHLVQPILKPIEQLKTVAAFDFSGGFSRINTQINELDPVTYDNPKAFVEGLFAPLSKFGDYIKDSELVKLIVSIGGFLGLDGIESWTGNLDVLVKQVREVLEKRVGGVFIGVVALGSVTTSLENTRRFVETLSGLFSIEATNTRLEAAVQAYGEGNTTLSSQLSGLNLDDAAQVEAVTQHLRAAREAFSAYHGALVRDLAFTEASLALLDVDALKVHFEQAGEALSCIETAQLEALAASLHAFLERIKGTLVFDGEIDLGQLKSTVQQGFAQVKEELDKLDPAHLEGIMEGLFGIIQEPLKQIESFKVEVEALVRDAFQAIKDAIDQIDLSAVKTSFEQALGAVETRIGEVDQAVSSVRTAVESTLNVAQADLEGVRRFILDPESGLKKQIEDVFGTVLGLLEDLDIKGVVDTVSQTVQSVAGELQKVAFAPVVNATIDAIETVTDVLNTVAPLLVTDDLKMQLAEATDFLRQVDFDAITDALVEVFDEILEAIDQDALAAMQREYEKVVEAVSGFDPTPALLELQAEVFDPLVAALEEVRPAEHLKPLQDAFEAASDTLKGFDPTETFAFLRAFFDEIMTAFNAISPDQLLAPIEEALEEVRATLNDFLRLDEISSFLDALVARVNPLIDQLDVTSLLRGMGDGVAALRSAIEAFDPSELFAPAAGVLRGLVAPLGLDINAMGLGTFCGVIRAGSAQMGTRYQGLHQTLVQHQDEVAQLDLQSALMTLRTHHDALKAALNVHDAAHASYAMLALAVQALDPMPVLSPLISRVTRVKDSYAAKTEAFAQVLQQGTPTFESADQVLAAFEAFLNPVQLAKDVLLEPIRRLFPDHAGDDLRGLLLRFVDELDPTQWRSMLEQIAQTIQAKIKALSGDAVIGPVKNTLDRIKGLVDLLDISVLADAIRGVHAEVEEALLQFDPTPFLDAVDATYQRILGVLENLNPKAFIAQIDQLYTEHVVGVVKAISPVALLLEPLKDLFGQISGLLGTLDIQALFAPVLDHLRLLRDQLDEGLREAGAAYNEMLDAIPTDGGGAGVSVSASASS